MAPRPRLGEHRNSSSASRSRQQTALQALPPDESSSEDDCKDVGVHLQSSRRSNTFIRRDSRLTDYGNDDYAPRFPYSFTPSRASTGLASATSTGSGGGVPETEGLPEMNGHANMVESVKHRLDPGHVFKSRYTGEGFLGGVHTADLTVTAHKRHEHRPLFRWINLKHSVMGFDAFVNEASQIAELTCTKGERQGITDLLTRVRRKYVKTAQTYRGDFAQHMEPSFFQQALPSEGSLHHKSSSSPRFVSWICLPYFSLEKYSGLAAAATDGACSGFPAQTLLQAHFSRTMPERDLQQAVCTCQKGAAAQLCFHIAQLWGVVVDNSLLLTCSTMDEKALCRNVINLDVRKLKDLTEEETKPKVQVCYGKFVTWSIALDECRTWHDFMTHFFEFLPRRPQFFRCREQVTSEEWPKIWNLARHAKIILDLHVQDWSSLPSRGILNPLQGGEADRPRPRHEETVQNNVRRATKAKPTSDKTLDFCVFGCRSGNMGVPSSSVDEDVLYEQLAEVETFILRKTDFGDRGAYQRCPVAERAAIHRQLMEESTPTTQLSMADTNRCSPDDYEDRVDFFNLADQIFRFFFPPASKAPTVGQYWGVIQSMAKARSGDNDNDMVQARNRERYKRTLIRLLATLRPLADLIAPLAEIFAHVPVEHRASMTIGPEFVQAWLHLVMALVHADDDIYKSETLVFSAITLVEEGIDDTVTDLTRTPLLDRSTVLPMELVTLISSRLLRDITPGLPDIVKTYSSSLEAIELDVTTKRTSRANEIRINLLKQEISVVNRTLQLQAALLGSIPVTNSVHPAVESPPPQGHSEGIVTVTTDAASVSVSKPRKKDSRAQGTHIVRVDHRPQGGHYSGTMNRRTQPDILMTATTIAEGGMNTAYNNHKLSSIEPGGFHDLFLQECLTHIGERQRDFIQFGYKANELESMNRNKVDINKDRQQQAIYVFTIVTMVFLPLTFVSSLFGMNTSDIQNMEQASWLYWAIALPVTAFVIFLGSLWTGELRKLIEWTKESAMSTSQVELKA